MAVNDYLTSSNTTALQTRNFVCGDRHRDTSYLSTAFRMRTSYAPSLSADWNSHRRHRSHFWVYSPASPAGYPKSKGGVAYASHREFFAVDQFLEVSSPARDHGPTKSLLANNGKTVSDHLCGTELIERR